jgi:sarcosine oxidase subunit beta
MRKPDAIVIGGGVIGAAVTYELSTRGVNTVLLEGNEPASKTSGACGGYVWLSTKKAGPHLRLAHASLKLLREFIARLGHRIECNQAGEFLLVEDDLRSSHVEEFVATRRAAGIEVQVLDRDEAQRIQPALDAEKVEGALYSPVGVHINPLDLVFGLVEEARKNQAEVRLHTTVESIRVSSGRVKTVHTNRGTIDAPFVVNAAGVYAPAMARLVNVDLPIIPMRGQVLVTEPAPASIRIPSLEFRYLAVKRNRELLEKTLPFGITCAVSQYRNGNIYIGTTKEFVGEDNRVTPGALRAIGQRASRFYPFLSRLRVIRTYAGLRPFTRDGLPMIGRVKDVDGYIVAAGHGGDGIALSMITGRLVAELITTGNASLSMDELSPSRFAGEDRYDPKALAGASSPVAGES